MSTGNKPKFSVEEGMALREQGKTHKEIAAILGCSEIWCKKNLSKPKQEKTESTLVDDVFAKAMSKVATTSAEIAFMVRGENPEMKEDDVEKKSKAVKKAIKRKDPEAIVRPRWMLPECPRDCHNMILDMADQVHTLMHSLAQEYRKKFDLDVSFQNGIVYELSRLSAPLNSNLLPQGLEKRGEQLNEIICVLEKRNND